MKAAMPTGQNPRSLLASEAPFLSPLFPPSLFILESKKKKHHEQSSRQTIFISIAAFQIFS